LSWDAISGASAYQVRLNQEPYGDWANYAGGDQDPTSGTNSINLNITAGANYQWNIQGIKSGESYPYLGCTTPWYSFNCGTSISAWWQVKDGDVQRMGIW